MFNKIAVIFLSYSLLFASVANAAYIPVPVPPSMGGTGLTSVGTNGQCLQSNGTATVWGSCGSGGGAPGGSTNAVQYNAGSGSFGGVSLTDGQLTVGQTGSTPLAKTIGGDCTLAASGSMVCLKANGVLFATIATSGSASDLSTGTVAAARLPNPSSSTIGGVQSIVAATHQWIDSISTLGIPHQSQPAFTDISGTATVGQGGTGLTSGTSGGIVAFTASGTLASSGALTANAPVIGGGAGVAPTVGTKSGNTTIFATSTGTLTNGHCVSIDVNGNLVDSGGACGSGSGITRSVSNISTTTTAGAAASTDYVYNGTVTLQITLPTAVGNTNRYTVKNSGSGIVTIATTSAQTIDGASTAVISVQYGALDLVSNGTNWMII